MLTGASAWGTDWLGETKVVSPFTSQRRAGRGTQATGGAPADVGHLYSFGSTEEALHRTILGLAPRGLLHDPPFDHATGKGRVAFHKGDYYDARSTKNNQVVPLIIEVFGGVGTHAERHLKQCARRARDAKTGRDGTRYSRFHPENYLSHHLAAIVTSAVMYDADHIAHQITALQLANKTKKQQQRRRAAA